MSENILVTGSHGQLGSELRDISSLYTFNFFFTCKEELDISDQLAVESFVENNNISIIINCAAYTAVDKAENDAEMVDTINHKSIKYLAKIAKEKNIKLIHISTDYVFDGTNHKPYVETDRANPISVYGKSKLDGENTLLESNPQNSIIIRTSWLYSSYGANFLKTMLQLGSERESLGVVYDQIGTPTYASDLAKAILEIVPKLINENVEIFHYANEGVLSWFDFAKEIMKMAKLTCKINPIETSQYPMSAKRPYFSLLNNSKIKKYYDIEIPYWKDSLKECLEKVLKKP